MQCKYAAQVNFIKPYSYRLIERIYLECFSSFLRNEGYCFLYISMEIGENTTHE